MHEVLWDKGFRINTLGVAYALSENRKAAIDDFTQSLRINPNFALAYFNRGTARRALGDNKGATADFQKASELFQQQGEIAEYQYTLDLILKINDR